MLLRETLFCICSVITCVLELRVYLDRSESRLLQASKKEEQACNPDMPNLNDQRLRKSKV